jgi:hypothetical protein
MLAGLRAAAQIPHAPIDGDEPPTDDVRSVSWAMDSAIVEETGEPPLPWEEMDEEDRERIRRITAGLRDAGWVRVGKPEGDAVWSLTRAIIEECALANGFVITWNAAAVAARMAYAAFGGREAALEAACYAVDMLTRSAFTHQSDEWDNTRPMDVWKQVRAALALTPTDAAKAVRELVKAASEACRVVLDPSVTFAGDDADRAMGMFERLNAALRPFGGTGDA